MTHCRPEAMSSSGLILVVIGAALLAGYAAHVVGSRANVPRVTLLLLIGIGAGPQVAGVVPVEISSLFPLISQFALAAVGFLLGEEFVYKKQQHSSRTLAIALLVTLVTSATVAGATRAAGAPLDFALVLGAIAAATAPAAVLDVVRESRARGPLTDTVLGVVAADDLLGIILFSIVLAVVEGMAGHGSASHELLMGLWDIGGAAVIGIALGFPMAWLTGRLRKGEPAVLEALGFVFLAAGLASLAHVSFLLTSMTLGGTVALRAAHHTRAVHEIEGFSTPILALFFLFAGFSLEVGALPEIGVVGAAYVGARIVGRLLGAAATRALGASRQVGRRLGFCLLPQAGVALGLALLASQRVPSISAHLLPLVIPATVLFELIGPPLLRYHLGRAGETADSSTTANNLK